MTSTPSITPLTPECVRTRDLLPLREAGTLPPGAEGELTAHVASCEACAAEARFLARVAGARVEVPAGLTARVLDGVRREARRPVFTPARTLLWGLPIAAALILALGTNLLWNTGNGSDGGWGTALEAPTSTWGDEEWMVAGAPHLGGVSDDVLRDLMEEIER